MNPYRATTSAPASQLQRDAVATAQYTTLKAGCAHDISLIIDSSRCSCHTLLRLGCGRGWGRRAKCPRRLAAPNGGEAMLVNNPLMTASSMSRAAYRVGGSRGRAGRAPPSWGCGVWCPIMVEMNRHCGTFGLHTLDDSARCLGHVRRANPIPADQGVDPATYSASPCVDDTTAAAPTAAAAPTPAPAAAILGGTRTDVTS
jgi:hypothetical protein